MGRTAILVDGAESEIAEDLVVPLEGVGGRPGRWVGIGIGVLTAIVAMGALGQDARPTAERHGGDAACAVATPDTAVRPELPTPAPSLHEWWRDSAVFVWVDPATGLLRERARPPREMATDGRRDP